MSAKDTQGNAQPTFGTPEWDEAMRVEMARQSADDYVDDVSEPKVETEVEADPADKETPSEKSTPKVEDAKPPAGEERIAKLEKDFELAEKRVKDAQSDVHKTRATNRKLSKEVAELKQAHKALEIERHKASAPDPDDDMDAYLAHRDKGKDLEAEASKVIEDVEDVEDTSDDDTGLTPTQKAWYETVHEGCGEGGVDIEAAWQDPQFKARALKLGESLGEKWSNPAVATAKLVALKQTMDKEAAALSVEKASKERNLADQDVLVDGGSASGAETSYSERQLINEINKMSSSDLEDVDAFNAKLAKLRTA